VCGVWKGVKVNKNRSEPAVEKLRKKDMYGGEIRWAEWGGEELQEIRKARKDS